MLAGSTGVARAAGLHYVVGGGARVVAHPARLRRSPIAMRKDVPFAISRTLDRIRSLVIPPAWSNVWICARPDGHLQATGRDARGRKQHRYHPQWTAARNESKFDQMIEFASRFRPSGSACRPISKPCCRAARARHRRFAARADADTDRQQGIRRATILRPDDAPRTTRPDQRRVMKFHFRAKSGVMQTIELDDASVRASSRSAAVPGRTLFQYLDGDGKRQCVDSAAVNDIYSRDYRPAVHGEELQDWAATSSPRKRLRSPRVHVGHRVQAERRAAVDSVAAKLGNTRAVCRNSYIHPLVFEGYGAA